MNYVVALGFFDLIHKGHISIFNKTVELAKKMSASPAVFTFSNDIYKVLGKKFSPLFDKNSLVPSTEKILSMPCSLINCTRSEKQLIGELFLPKTL